MFKQSKGITLIALVVTIVIMLILVGISISTFTGSGLINQTKQAKLESKRAQIREYLILKLTEEKIENPFGSSLEIVTATRENVIKNISELEKYGKDITIEEVKFEEDGKDIDAYFYVTIDDDFYRVELSGVIFVGESNGNSKNIIISDYIGVYDGNPHTATIKYLDDGVRLTYGISENSYTLLELPEYTDAGTYIIYWKATKGDTVVENGTASVIISKAKPTINLSIEDGHIVVNTNSDGNVKAICSNTSIANVTVEDKIINIIPIKQGEAGSFVVSVNITESANYCESAIKTQDVTVSKNLITSDLGWYSSSSLCWSGYYTVNGNTATWNNDYDNMWHTTDNIGLQSGYYYLAGNTGGAPRAVLWSDSARKTLSFGIKGDSSFVVEKTSYLQIPMLVSGNEYEIPSNWNDYDLRKVTFEIIPEENVKITYNPSKWTNGDVTVSASITVSGYTIQTSKDGTIWENKSSQVYNENGTVYVRLSDGINTREMLTGNITNIDKNKPEVTETTSTTNKISIIATDDESGIIGYAVTTTSDEPSANNFKSVTNTELLNETITDLEANKIYYVWVKDEAGNISSRISVATKEATILISNSTFASGVSFKQTNWSGSRGS